MRKVLVIAYYFPPAGGGGVQRTVKFAKYLSHFGWQPYILTVHSNSFQLTDQDVANDLPEDVKIIRTRNLISRKRTDAFRQKTLINQDAHIKGGKRIVKGVINRLLWLFRDLFLVPDAQVDWIPFALAPALKLLRKEKIEAIYTTGGPFSTFLIGYVLKKFTHKPWVVDFRDSWTQSSSRSWENRFRKGLERHLEHMVIKNANKVITVTKPMQEYFLRIYPELPPSKFTVIPNGFDPDDFNEITVRKPTKFTICYTGRIGFEIYSPECFFQALSQLFNEDVAVKDDIQVIFVGTFEDSCRFLVSKYKLENVVRIENYLPHREAIRHQKMAHLLLLLFTAEQGGEEILTGKLLEYLNHGTPILALVPQKSEAAKLIDQTKAGVVIDPQDVAKIKRAVGDYYTQYKHGNLSVKRIEKSILRKFDRVELTGKLSEQLNSVL